MKGVQEYFGEGWRQVDAIHLDNIDTRRDIAGEKVGPFSMAVKAVLRSLCRIDGDGYLKTKRAGTYKQLRAGMFTLADVFAEVVRYRNGKYIYGFSVKSHDLLDDWFFVEGDGDKPKTLPTSIAEDVYRALDEIGRLAVVMLATPPQDRMPTVQRASLQLVKMYAEAGKAMMVGEAGRLELSGEAIRGD